MHPHIGAAGSSPLDLIASLQAITANLKSQNGADTATSPFGATPDPTAGAAAATPAACSGSGAPSMTPDLMNALFATQGQTSAASGSPPSLSSQLFSLLDTNGDGSISKSEFDTTLGQNGNTAKADSVFAKLDTNNDGSVSPTELASALQGQNGQVHHHHHHGGGGEASGASGASGAGGASAAGASAGSGAGADDLLGAGNSGQTVNNADGSTTTTLSYADGSQVTMTTPAAGSSGTGAASHNFLERMIQHQAQMLAASTAGQSVAMSV
jgi:hypothetical protein